MIFEHSHNIIVAESLRNAYEHVLL